MFKLHQSQRNSSLSKHDGNGVLQGSCLVPLLLIAALAALYIKTISKVRYLCLFLSFCRFVVKSIQCQSRLQSEFVALPLLWHVRGNSARSQLRTVLRVVNGFGVSKFDVKPHTLPILIVICNLFPTFEE